MADADDKEIHIGQHGEYQWLTSGEDYMGTLVRLCPEVVIGRYVVVTSMDSGVPWLTEKQKHTGWECRGGAAYSGLVRSTEELFYQRDGPDGPGYDEWYIFESAVDLGEVSMRHPFLGAQTPKPEGAIVFVNYPFTIHDEDPLYGILRKLFWAQIEKLQPQSYIADGRDCLTFVSRNAEFFQLVRQQLGDR